VNGLNQLQNFFTPLHKKTNRDYQARANDQKSQFALIAKRFDYDYWDGKRETGYGGYYDDGRWEITAKQLIDTYKLKPGDKILDVGCGKGFLLNEIKKIIPEIEIFGFDVSEYAISKIPISIKKNITVSSAEKINYPESFFDLVISINVLHNLELEKLMMALSEIQRVSKKNSYVCVESYRNEVEKWNLLRWQLTCEAFYTPKSWEYIFMLSKYMGDYEFIYFE
jgi:protein-L-isoaspartate(D-aspartate) O-methyltransferase